MQELEADFQVRVTVNHWASVSADMQNALDQANARHEDQLKKLEKKLTEQSDKKIERHLGYLRYLRYGTVGSVP